MLDKGIQTYIPQSDFCTTEGRFKPSDYQYDESADCYFCPNDQRLTFGYYDPRLGGKIYRSSAKGYKNYPYATQCHSEKATRKVLFRKLHQAEYEIQC